MVIRRLKLGITSSRAYRNWQEKRLIKRKFREPPIEFEVDGRKVKLFRHGFANPFQAERGNERPLVFAVVNGKLIQFFESTGKGSGRQGVWIPAADVFFGRPDARPSMTMYDVHPNRLPKWVEDISQRINRAEWEGHIEFHPDWSKHAFFYIRRRIFPQRRFPRITSI